MKRFLITFLFVLAASLNAQASITLQVGDVVTYLGRAVDSHGNHLYEGNGGAFSWSVTASSPPSSAPGTLFQSFCDELQQSIHAGTNYTVSSVFTPVTGVVINSSGNILGNMQGIYLFDLWSNGLLTKSASTAGAVQVGTLGKRRLLNDGYHGLWRVLL